MKLFTLYGDLELATKNFNSGVEAARAQMAGLKTQMDGLQEDAGKTSSILDGALGHALGDILSGVTQSAIETAFKMTSDGLALAGDMETLESRLQFIFGDSQNSIESWAQKAKYSFGLGRLAAIQYAADLGDALKDSVGSEAELASMSTDLLGVAADLAAITGKKTTDAVQALLSAFRGEAEPIEKFSLNMSQSAMAAYALSKGLIEAEGGWSKLPEAEKDMIRYSYVMEETAEKQGFYAENSEKYNQQLAQMEANIEQLKMSMGQSLLPVMTELVGWFNSLFGESENASAGLDAIKDSAADSLVSIETTTANALALVNALKDLEATGEDASSSETWNALLGELRVVLPEIGSLIDNETGKITGGTAALEAYVAQWRTTSMELAQQKVVQDMYDEYAVLQAELAKLQTEQNIADTLRAGAVQSMDEMGEQLLATMLYGMEKMGASAADIKAMQQFGAEGAENLLARLAGGGNTAMVMGALLQGGDIVKNKSYEKYFEAGGGTDAMLSNMIALYQGYQKTFEKYNVDNSEEIAERQALLAGQEQEISVLQQILTQLAENGSVVVNNYLDGEAITSTFEQNLSTSAKNKSLTAGN